MIVLFNWHSSNLQKDSIKLRNEYIHKYSFLSASNYGQIAKNKQNLLSKKRSILIYLLNTFENQDSLLIN